MNQKMRQRLRKEWLALPNREQLTRAVKTRDASYIRGVLQVQERMGWSKTLSEYLRGLLSQWQSPASSSSTSSAGH